MVTSTNGFPETKLIMESFGSSIDEAIDWPREASLALVDDSEIQLASLLELQLLADREIGVDSLVDNFEEELLTLFRLDRDEELTLAPSSLKSPARLCRIDGDASYCIIVMRFRNRCVHILFNIY